MHSRRLQFLSVIIVAWALPVVARAQPLTCGQVVSTDAILTGDLDCSGFPEALILSGEVQLELAGFSLSGAPVGCDDKCTIKGPGTVNGVQDANGAAPGPRSIRLSDATANGQVGSAKRILVTDSVVNGNVTGIIVEMTSSTVNDSTTDPFSREYAVFGERVTLTDVDVSNAADHGVYCARCLVEDSTISGNAGVGIQCEARLEGNPRPVGKVDVYDSLISDNGASGIHCARKARIYRTTIRDNADEGIYVYAEHSQQSDQGVRIFGNVLMSDSTVQGNRWGLTTRKATVRTSSITNNGFAGVKAFRMLLDAATVVDNNTDPQCTGTETCYDLGSDIMPRLLNGSTCDTSYVLSTIPAESWGVCALD
jgi:hypothetical protein